MIDGVVGTILFFVALGLLICLHELGHFLFAKLFNVYCHEFSIGFGPALIHTRKEGKETYFSLRCIPLGGYVAMAGEDGDEFEDGVKVPPERSIEGIKKWKKAIVISAGIVVNTILAFVFIAISNLCFPHVISSSYVKVSENSVLVNRVIEDERLNLVTQDPNYYFSYQFTDSNGVIHADMFAIVDEQVALGDNIYVLTYTPTGTKEDVDLSSGLKLYPSVNKDTILADEILNAVYSNWISQEDCPSLLPDVTNSTLNFTNEKSFDAELKFINEDSTHTENVTFIVENKIIQSIGLSLKSIEEWLPINERWNNTWSDFGNASSAVVEGLITLFKPNGYKNMSGIVGIFTYSNNLYSNYTFSTYLYFWGMISINLALFNLLPFPGLDGWQLLVTVVEGISRKKLPTKFKSIMSLIGFALLIGLMILVLVLDITALV